MPATGTTGTHYGTKKSKSGNTRAAHARGVVPNSSRNTSYRENGSVVSSSRQLKLDGEWYKFSGGSHNHADETERAARIRAKGLKARIVKSHGVWAVYTRKA